MESRKIDPDEAEVRRMEEDARARYGSTSRDSPKAIVDEIVAIGERMAAGARAAMSWRDSLPPERQARTRLTPAEALMKHIPPLFRWATLDSVDLPRRCPARAIAAGRRAVDEIRVVLVGPSGKGKTSLVVAMLRAWAIGQHDWQHVPAYVPARALAAARASHGLGEGEPALVGVALAARLLVIDDLGSENRVPSSAVPDVIAERHEQERATWITTWMRPNDVAQRYGEGVARRVYEGATVIDFGEATL